MLFTKKIRFILLLLLGVPGLLFAQDKFPIGNVVIDIPPPKGAVRVDGKNPEWDRTIVAFIPAGNRLIANYGPPADLALLESGQMPNANESYQVQTLRAAEAGNVTIADMKAIRKAMDEQFKNIDKTLRNQTTKSVTDINNQRTGSGNTPLDLKLGEVRQLGIFEESDTSLSFAMAMKMSVKAAAKTVESTMFVSCTILLVKGKLVYLYANVDESIANAEALSKNRAREWREAIVAMNPEPVSAGNSAGNPRSETITYKIIRGAIIGAAIGLLIALLNKVRGRKES